MQKHKSSLIRTLEDTRQIDEQPEPETTLTRTAALLRACPAYGQFLMLGSDFIDAVTTLYTTISLPLKQRLIVIMYRCFLSLLDPVTPKYSMLLDHLYGLHPSLNQDSLLSALCSSTPFVRKLQGRIAGPEAIRAEKLIQQLSAFEGRGTLPPKRRRPARTKADKGKGKQNDEYGHGAFDGNLHVHKMSLVTQIQDLFPDLGSGFLIKLLDEYGNDAEQVIAHLLDDSLPPHLKSLDQSENLPDPTPVVHSTDLAPRLSPRNSPPLFPTRRNIHDDDAFDRLAISPSQIHRGLKPASRTADTILQDRSSAPNKAAILSALAAFDSDDDERDDTYDVGDVGGTVDAGNDEVDADALLEDQNEETLFRAWKLSPEAGESASGVEERDGDDGRRDRRVGDHECEGSEEGEEVGGQARRVWRAAAAEGTGEDEV
ncbi:MAG: hypothetical protein Q9216_004419 [Gyalolechia sp. 2 TL-2023]